MADILGYLSVLLIVGISGAGLYPDFFTNTSKRTRIGLLILLLAATLLALYSLHEGNLQHSEDAGQIKNLEKEVKDAGDRQEKNAQQFILGQKDSSTNFASKYGELSNKLASLQVGIKSANLQQEADQLRSELQTTQKALTVPRATLTFSLKDTNPATLSEALPVHDDVVHVSFLISNLTTTDALDGDVALLICSVCTFAKEPPSFVRVNGSPDNQRNFPFQHILGHSQAQLLEADIKIPSTEPVMVFGVKLLCRTCETVEVGNPTPEHTAFITLVR
jgi:hypothetical protein